MSIGGSGFKLRESKIPISEPLNSEIEYTMEKDKELVPNN